MNNVYEFKKELILKRIKDSNLTKYFIKKVTKNNKYSIEIYVDAYILFEKYEFTTRKYDEFVKEFNLNLPKRTQLIKFINKISKINLLKDLFFSIRPKTFTELLSIDSTFIVNRSNCKNVDRNYHYYNKKGIKVTVIIDENCLPVTEIDVSKGSINDCKIGNNVLQKLPNGFLKNKYLLADAGYDSSILRKTIKKGEGKCIIPKNKRNKKTKQQKKIIENIQNSYKIILENVEADKIEKTKKLLKLIKLKKVPVKKRKFNRGVGKTKNIKYKKRIEVEHFFSKLKNRKLREVTCKKIENIKNFIYSRCIDILFFKNRTL